MTKTMTQLMKKKKTKTSKVQNPLLITPEQDFQLAYHISSKKKRTVLCEAQSVSLSCDGRLFLFYGPMVISIILRHDHFRAVVVIMLGS